MPKKQKMNSEELERASGGGFGDFSFSELREIRKQAEERGTCLRCGRKFEESEIKGRSLGKYGFMMDFGDAEYLVINLCGDCLSQYGSDDFWKNWKH